MLINNKEPLRRRHPQKTARELAEQYNVSERTIRSQIAEKRSDFEERARNKRLIVYNLRHKEKKTFKEIAVLLDTSVLYARRLFAKAKSEFN